MASRDDQERLYEQSPSEHDLRRRGRESAAKESEWPGHTGVYHVGFMQGAQYEAAHQRARYERLVEAAEEMCDFDVVEVDDIDSARQRLRAALAELRETEGGSDG